MTVQRLSQYRHLCRELEQLEETLAKYEIQCFGARIQAPETDGMREETAPQGEGAPIRRARGMLRLRRRRLLRERTAIEDFIDALEDSRLRQILQMRYLQGVRPPSWQSIALRMGWTDESTPRRLARDFLRGMQDERGLYKKTS